MEGIVRFDHLQRPDIITFWHRASLKLGEKRLGRSCYTISIGGLGTGRKESDGRGTVFGDAGSLP